MSEGETRAAPALRAGSVLDTLHSLGSDRETGLTTAEAETRLRSRGPNEVLEPKAHPFRLFATKFWSLSAWMLELIALLSLVLNKWADLAVAISLLVANAILSFLQEQRASAAVAALRHRLQVTARVRRDSGWRGIPARELVVGDIVRVRGGDFVPADLQLLEGKLLVDQSALTGESREVGRATDDPVHSGSVVRQGEATGVVTATGARTFFGRTTELVQSARPRLHVEAVITRLVKWLFLIVGTLVAVAVAGALASGVGLLEILPLSLVLLMSAVPVALPVMFTVSMAVGSIELGRRGVLITRLSAAEDAANMDVVCVDKTGTLTQNRLTFAGALPEAGFTEGDVLRAGAWASNEANQDPIDLAFLDTARERGLIDSGLGVRSFTPFSAAIRRTEAIVDFEGRASRVMKGALRTIAGEAACTPAAIAALEASADAQAQKGFRVLAVARAEGEGPVRLVGLALLHDAPRPDSRRLIEELRDLGISVKMLTGDALPVAREIARELGMGRIVRAPELRAARAAEGSTVMDLVRDSDGFAEVFPEDKFLVVKSLQEAGHVVGMTGDGVNDAPALRQAEVGIAVSGATDVAKGAASVVLTAEGLASIVDLVTNGRAIYQRVLTWIVNKVSRTILKAGYVVFAFLMTGKFVISALGMVLLVFMTDFVKIALSTDRVRPSRKPETWNIGPLVGVAVVLGLLMLAESLGLLAIGWHRFDLGNEEGRLHTFAFQTLLFFALFSIVSIRERRFFWRSRPSPVLAAALFADGCVGILIGVHGLAGLRPLPLEQTGFVLGFAMASSLLVNDWIKTILIARSGRVPGPGPAARTL